MVVCTLCTKQCSTDSDYRLHLQQHHPGDYVFRCKYSGCERVYKHKASLRRHQNSCTAARHDGESTAGERRSIPTDAEPLGGKDMVQLGTTADLKVTPSKKRKMTMIRRECLPGQELPQGVSIAKKDTLEPREVREGTGSRIGEAEHFRRWCSGCNSRPSGDTATNIIRLLRSDELEHLVWVDALLFEECINSWQDRLLQRKHVLTKTVSTYYRYLRWFACYLQSTDAIPETIMEFLDDRVYEMQRVATMDMVRENCLTMLDPYGMNELRNTVVRALVKQQRDVIDPFVVAQLRFGQTSPKELVEFGITHLRNWLDLVLRFCNVPCRVQVTNRLKLEDCTDDDGYVSKLVRHKEQYSRLINRDKTAASRQPISIPMGPIISSYMHFYLTQCRPESSSQFVFTTRTGKPWKRASRDIKHYVCTVLGIDTLLVDPTGRFIHGSRHVVLSSYALRVDFDHRLLQDFTTLMRHSIKTAEKYYNVWADWCRSNQAIANFSNAMGFKDCDDIKKVRSRDVITESLALPHALIRTLFRDSASVTNQKTVFTVRDVGTQTGVFAGLHLQADEKSCNSRSQHPGSSVPDCTLCSRKLQLFGPCGNTRSRYVGHYFLQCETCLPSKRLHKSALILPSGWVPPEGIASRSSKPRNLDRLNIKITS
jgi:hypothetical protein